MPDDVVSFFGDDDWHWARDANCIAEVLSQIKELSHYYSKTFPDEPWIPGATVNGYTITPISPQITSYRHRALIDSSTVEA